MWSASSYCCLCSDWNWFAANENSGKKRVLATEAMRCSRLIAWRCGLAVVRGEVGAQAFGAHTATAVLVAA
jgi:hypothetical protein